MMKITYYYLLLISCSLLISGCGRSAKKVVGAIATAAAAEVAVAAATQVYEESQLGSLATIHSTYAEHNVFQTGEKGMRIHVDLNVSGHKGKTCSVITYFSKDSGEALSDLDGKYRTQSGKVSASTKIKPRYDNARFNDVTFFLPYAQLHLDGTSHHNVNSEVRLYSNNLESFIGNRSSMQFTWGPQK